MADAFRKKFAGKGVKLDAQVMAVALAVYATNSSLGGTTARAYGFEVTAAGLGAARYNVGKSGAAFGVANHTVLTVVEILGATDRLSEGGGSSIYNGSEALRSLANLVYDGINDAGDIG